MKCSNENCSKKDLTEKDFYWHSRSLVPTLKSRECKHCHSEKNKQKYQERKPEKFPFAWV